MSARACAGTARGFVLACTLAALPTLGAAQDSFGAAPLPQPTPQPRQEPQRPAERGGDGRQSAPASETQDFGVPPQAQLRPTQQLHGPTPTAIPGGKVIGTRALAQLLRNPQAKALLFHAYGAPQHLPNAIPAGPAAQGGSFDDQVQREFGQFLQKTVGDDNARPLVFYCQGVQCWMSYNAALRAIRMGYRNVLWYRGGIEAWAQAGLPVQTAPGGGEQPQATR